MKRRIGLDIEGLRRLREGISYYGLGDGPTDEVEMEVKPLQPLNHGNILLVGVKASNFDDEIRTHPRIVMWDSQQEHWTNKDIPHNTQAIFVTRWIGHAAFGKILKEARKRHITMFNPEGTGMIVRQVKELLDMSPKPTIEETIVPTPTETKSYKHPGKLQPLHQFIDYSKGPMDNAKVLMQHAQEMGISTTMGTLTNMVGQLRKKRTGAPTLAPRGRHVSKSVSQPADISFEILDNVIKELQDLKVYLVDTIKDNESLKLRIERFKKALDSD